MKTTSQAIIDMINIIPVVEIILIDELYSIKMENIKDNYTGTKRLCNFIWTIMSSDYNKRFWFKKFLEIVSEYNRLP